MKRPAWAETAAFSNCWSHLELVRKVGVPYAGSCLEALAQSRVIKIDREQVDALPLELGILEERDGSKMLDYRALEQLWREIRNPFSVTFLDLSEAQIPMFLNDTLATAALVIDPVQARQFGLLPSDRSVQGPLIFPFLHYPEGRPGEPIGIAVTPMSGEEGITGFDLANWEAKGQGQFEKATNDCVALAERAITCLAWLMSFNVELVEAPLSSRQRKRELAKGRQIALTVAVRQSRRTSTSTSADHRINYAHRFETRGHFRHHFETKPDGSLNKMFASCLSKDSSRLIEVDGKPCFRFWVPPFVKGPVDKPFVPKIRVASEERRVTRRSKSS